MGKIINFDQFISDKNKEIITVTVYGKDYQAPGEVPAIVPVMMARSEVAMDANESTKLVMRAADAFFGKDAVDEMCQNGMSAHDLSVLVQMLFQKIHGKDEDDEETEELTDEDSRKPTAKGKNEKK